MASEIPCQSETENLPFKMVNRESPPEEKIDLFRSLFKGREDVYPKRFESQKTGKVGSPVQMNGIRGRNIPAYLERSRSGRGGHVWMFFEHAIPAGLARKLGSLLLTETMERHPGMGLNSYDRLFPNQDTLPEGGFGNLIALPLQGEARKQNNSVFLDDSFSPFPDQWAFLSEIRRTHPARVEEIVREGEQKGGIIRVRLVPTEEDDDAPWTTSPSRQRKSLPLAEPLPAEIEIILGDQTYVPKESLGPGLMNRLIRIAAYQNPEFYKAQAMRLSTFEIHRIIGCAENHSQHIGLPRGCLEEARQLFSDLGIKTSVRDERFQGTPLKVSFQGKLRDEQIPAAEAMAAHETGILAATTAFGKTVIGAWLIAQRGVNTLVVVHRRQLMDQWVERLSSFLGIPAKSIGRIGGGKKKPTGKVDVAIIHSLVRKKVVDDLVGEYGHIIFDECHHLAADNFVEVARRTKAKFITGLSATVTRKDGQHPKIFMQCGPVRHKVDARLLAKERPFSHAVWVRPTGFRSIKHPDADLRAQFQDLYSELPIDGSRNNLIVEDVLQAIGEGRSPLVLTERKDHLEELARRLEGRIPHLIVLHGKMKRKEMGALQARLREIPEDEKRVLLATGRFIGEGFDDSRLDTLFLTMPVSWKGTIAQYAGRLHRLNDRKREVRIFDYADLDVPMLSRMFDRRCRGYEAIGYSIQLLASAIPGWPADVLLPVDPEWKKEYAASVRRLVLDGVDSPLANLFVFAARNPPENADNIWIPPTKHKPLGEESRARSSTEAFLYRRLETLPQTREKFHLNLSLPISFNGNGTMEVDLICTETRLVIELDGPHHFSGPDAYRRDRRKDALLQENGFFVLRFLAEDVGKRLDDILDGIHRAMAHHSRRGGFSGG